MERDKFLEYLSIYGADMTSWPEEIRLEAQVALEASSELRDILKAEIELESALMERGFEESSPGLSQRIISNALGNETEKKTSLFGSIKELFSAFPIPSPAIALPALLVIGIVAGYLYPEESFSEPEGTQVAEIFYNEGGLYE